MAREAWISEAEAEMLQSSEECYLSCTYLADLKAFEALVRADAIADEREACAKEAENMNESVLALLNVTSQPKAIARKIRSRGNT
jgi:hypothetical protein